MKRKLLLCLALIGLGMVSMAQTMPISHIEVNNVQGTILGDGTLMLNQPSYYNGDSQPCPTWEVPAGSGKCTIFQHALWFGGMDGDSLHLAAMQFGLGKGTKNLEGKDYWPGPLKTTDATSDWNNLVKYYYIWNLTRAEIDQFIANHDHEGYQIPNDILTWPAHGEGEYAANLAPFVDVNNDGCYNPTDGDYPDIKGDQCLFFIFNDGYAEHTESEGARIGLEVHAMVYAFDAPDDEALNNTVFTNYKFYNRSCNNYSDTYLGLWYDWDLGYARDDYVGCDVQRDACYVYNGDSYDGSGESGSYADNCPIQVAVVLAGPTGNDGNRLGMSGFMYHSNYSSVMGDPITALDYYYLLQSRWLDGNHLQYGGDGYPGHAGVVGPECNYMFPGASDPDNIGTSGIVPNDGYNTNGKYWTEEEAGNQPEDRRGLATVGPFDLPAGSMRELDYASITVWKNDSQTAMERRGEFIDHIKAFFNNGLKK